MSRARAMGRCGALAWMALAGRASGGEAPTSALSWVRLAGAESCIAATELGTRVEAHLGRGVLLSPSTADVSIEGHVERRGEKFLVVIGGSRRDGRPIGTRQLESEGADCRSLDAGLVLVIALMIDPNAAAAPPLTAAVAPTREIVREIVVREIHDAPPASPPSRPWRIDAHVDATLALGRLPAGAPGAALGIDFGPSPRFPLELTLGASPSASARAGDRSASFSLVEGGLGVCPDTPASARIALGGCASVRLGSVRTVGSGFDRNDTTDRLLVDVVVGGRAAVMVAGPFFAVGTAAAVVPLNRQRTTFTAADGTTGVLHERAGLGAELAIGLGVHFSP